MPIHRFLAGIIAIAAVAVLPLKAAVTVTCGGPDTLRRCARPWSYAVIRAIVGMAAAALMPSVIAAALTLDPELPTYEPGAVAERMN